MEKILTYKKKEKNEEEKIFIRRIKKRNIILMKEL